MGSPIWKHVQMKRFVAIIVAVGLLAACGGATANSQKVPWHFWVFAGAAVVYLGGRRIQGLWMLVT